MKYFLKILREQKFDVKMNNQTDKGFDLIILTDEPYNRIMNKLNYCYKRGVEVNIAWEFKNKRNYFKLYKDVKMLSIDENFNPRRNKVEGMVIRFSCDNVEYFSPSDVFVGRNVPLTNKKYKSTNQLLRALKLSNIKFDVNEKEL